MYTRVLSIYGLSEQHTLAPLTLAWSSPGCGIVQPTASTGRERPTACAGICPPLSWLAGRPHEEGSAEVPCPPPFPQNQLPAVFLQQASLKLQLFPAEGGWVQLSELLPVPLFLPLCLKRTEPTWLAQASLNRRSTELKTWR